MIYFLCNTSQSKGQFESQVSQKIAELVTKIKAYITKISWMK